MRTHETLAAVTLIALLSGSAGAATSTTARPPGVSKPLPAQPAMVMPWIEDDYAKAISEAKARKLPVFVESWAPW